MRGLIGVLLIFLISCAPKVNFSEYTITKYDKLMAKGDLPSFIKHKKKSRVAVLPFRVNTRLARSCRLSTVAQDTVTDILSELGSVEVVERSEVDKLMEEVKFSQGLGGRIDTSKLAELASDINYVLIGNVYMAELRTRYKPRREYYDKDGKKHVVPSLCEREAKLGLSIRVVRFPSGMVVGTLKVKRRFTEEITGVERWKCENEKGCGLLADALVKAVEEKKQKLGEMFPVYGYIYRLMTHKKDVAKRIAFVTLGKGDGIEPGDTLKIVEFRKVKDPVTGRYFYEEYEIGECKVSSTKLEFDKSVCVIDDLETAKRVRIKHAVKK